jgi:hypothetical protein
LGPGCLPETSPNFNCTVNLPVNESLAHKSTASAISRLVIRFGCATSVALWLKPSAFCKTAISILWLISLATSGTPVGPAALPYLTRALPLALVLPQVKSPIETGISIGTFTESLIDNITA